MYSTGLDIKFSTWINIHYSYKIKLYGLGLTTNFTWLREAFSYVVLLSGYQRQIFSRMTKKNKSIKVVKFNINWCIKHKRSDTKNLYFSNTYLFKGSTKDTRTGANTHLIHPYHRVWVYMHSNSTIKILKQTQRCCSCFSVA